ncbi:sugar ABC transporter substrate-binding protein [Halorubrum sp. N11]|uniref:sugar ABC transporter substrate-binding protein n=1 Tax=Halorubrum sp. N11 TaxID=3402276 RepID=UPI003EBCA9A6
MSEHNSQTRRRFLIGSGAAGATALAGCTGGSDNQPDSTNTTEGDGTTTGGSASSDEMADKIVFYNAGSLQYDPGTAENIERFEEETGITVEVNEVPWNNLKTSLTTIWRNQSSKVDVFNGPTWWLADFVSSGWLDPLGLPDSHLNKFPDNLVDLVTFDGQAYMAPEFGKWGTFLYDTQKVESPPDTWDDVLSMNVDGVNNFGFTWANKSVFTFKQFLYQAGGQLFDGNQPAFQDAGMEVLEFFGGLREQGALPDGISSMGEGGVGDAFVGGQFATVESWTPLAARAMGADGWSKDRLGSAKPPKGPESRATFQDTNGISVSAFSKRKNAAKEFARFMTTQQSSKTNMLVEGNPSVVPSVYEDSEVQSEYPSWLLEDMRFNLENAMSETYLAQPQVDDYISEQVTPALLGKKEPQAALQAANDNIVSLYEDIGLL